MEDQGMSGGEASGPGAGTSGLPPEMTWRTFLETAQLEDSEEESIEGLESEASSASESDSDADTSDGISVGSESDSESELDEDRLRKYGYDFVHGATEAEAMDLSMEELELRATVFNKVRKLRKGKLEAERREREEAGVGVEEEGQEGSGDELRGVCSGKKRGKPTRAQTQKKTAAKERMVKKYFAKMESELGVTCWCYGFTTAAGKLRVGGSESMTRWMAVKYRAEALKVNLEQTGEIQQELAKLNGLGLAVLLQLLNVKQLSSLAAGWFSRCQPPLKAFPLDGSKGKPSWWPVDVAFKKAASLKKAALLRAALAAAECNCLGNAPDAAERKLERVLATSPLLCNEPPRVRAILHSAVAQALKSWQQSEPHADPQPGSAGRGEGQANGGGPPRTEAGTAAAGVEDGAGLEEGPFADVGGQRKRRRACDISERPYKCPEEVCNGHCGYTSRSGLDKHMKAKHPSSVRSTGSNPAATAAKVSPNPSTEERPPAPAQANHQTPLAGVHPTAPAAPGLSPNRRQEDTPPSPARESDPTNKAPGGVSSEAPGPSEVSPNPPPEDSARAPVPEARPSPLPKESFTAPPAPRVTPTAGATGARVPVPVSRVQSRQASGREEAATGAAPTVSPKRPGAADSATPTQPGVGSTPSAEAHRNVPAGERAPEQGGRVTEVGPKGKTRSRRVPGTAWGAAFRQTPRSPLQSVDENGVRREGRKGKRPREPTFQGTPEDYCDHMRTVGQDRYAGPPRPQFRGSASVREGKRRQAMLDRLPPALRSKPVADALDARPAKHLYRSLGAESFELLVSGRSKARVYESIGKADLRSLYDFARASKIESRGVSETEMRQKVQIALEYQVYRDMGLLHENGDHLRR